MKEGTSEIHTFQTVTKEIAAEMADVCDRLTDAQDEIARGLLDRATGKWPLWILHVLAEADAPLRFSRVLERVEGISQKVLTQALRNLERDGLVTRTLYPQVPPRVEYALTALGIDFLVQIRPIWHWLVRNIETFEAARRQFDGAAPAPARDR